MRKSESRVESGLIFFSEISIGSKNETPCFYISTTFTIFIDTILTAALRSLTVYRWIMTHASDYETKNKWYVVWNALQIVNKTLIALVMRTEHMIFVVFQH